MKKPVLAAVVLVVTTLAIADVQVQTLSRVSLTGGLGTMESNSKAEYQADKRAETRDFRIVGGIVGALSKGSQTNVDITRLDKDLVWELDPKAKTCTERPIALPTDQGPSGVKVETKTSGTPPPARHRVTKSELKVEKTGKTKDINGFPCAEYLMTWEVVLEDTATKEKTDEVMTTDLWTTPLTDDLKKAKAAQDAFNKAYARKLGADMDTAEMKDFGSAMLTSMYGVDSKEAAAGLSRVSAEMQKVEGYPIVTEVTWRFKEDTLKAAVKPESEEPKQEQPTSLGGLLSNKIAKAVTKEPKEPAKKDVLFSSHMEVKSVAASAVAPEDFEIPAGYKKVDKTGK